MLTSALPLIVACFFAGVLGFAAHRASICTVRAVAEIMSARTGYMLWSIGKSALWVIALTLPFLWLMPEAANAIGGWRLTLTTLLGGFLFGLGAALNGACAYSTMARLVDGEARMAVSVGGFAIGVLTFLLLVDSQMLARPEKAPALIGSVLSFALVIVLALAAWAIYEVPRIWRMRPKHLRIKHMILSPQYRLSSAALVIGIASSIVFLLVGSPGYTITLHSMVAGMVGKGALPAAIAQYFDALGAGRHAGVDFAARQLPPRLAAAAVLAAQYFRRRADGAWRRHGAGRQCRAYPLRDPEFFAARAAGFRRAHRRRRRRFAGDETSRRHRYARGVPQRHLPRRSAAERLDPQFARAAVDELERLGRIHARRHRARGRRWRLRVSWRAAPAAP